jgi:hypothetical protein
MDVAMIAGTLYILVFAAVLVVGKFGQNAKWLLIHLSPPLPPDTDGSLMEIYKPIGLPTSYTNRCKYF